MADTSLSVGAAFDAAVMQGDLIALVRLRRTLERIAALASCQRSIRRDSSIRTLGEALHDATVPLLERGAAVVEWQRLMRWMSLLRAGESRNGCEELKALAAQRREKAARKYRQWLTQPGCRSARKRLARALAHAVDEELSGIDLRGDWDTQRQDLSDVDVHAPASARHTVVVLQGWCEMWRRLGLDEPESAAHTRVGLLRSQQAMKMVSRLNNLLKHTQEPSAWQCAGVLQSQLQATADRHGDAARDAALMMRLPLTPRFGVRDRPAH